jgi:prepilin-type N-terminal cleavage/methylation domain-containing protein
MKSSRHRRGRAGFSLLEVMLAMVALALVSMICYGAFHLGIRAVEKGEVAVVTS